MTVAAVTNRSSLAVTFAVIRALVLREAVNRLFVTRTAWAWVFCEPLLHMLYLTALYSTVRVRKVGEIDTPIWVMVGLIGYFLFRKTGDQTAKAATENSALFAYRQVKPIDTLIARALLEAFNAIITMILAFVVFALANHPLLIEDPLEFMLALVGMWLLGMGYGLLTSSVFELVDELRLVMRVLMKPMYLVSGVILPMTSLPTEWRQVLMWNPVAQGLELARMAISSNYHPAPETDAAYFFKFILCMIALGLYLHRRFASKIAAR